MRRALALAAALAGLSFGRAALAEEPPPETRAFVEVTPDRDTPYAGEAFVLRLRIGYDAAWFRTHAVPLFLRATDLPLAVHAPWWDALPGASRLRDLPRDPADARPRLTVALGDEVVEAARVDDVRRDGLTFAVLELVRRTAAAAPGSLVMPAPQLRFATATRFQDDLLGNRVALDRREVVVKGRPLVLRVDALPEAGRPEGFAGAVGRFAIRAEVDRTDVRVGAPFRLTLRISGEGAVETLDPPRPALHVFGVLDDRGSPERTVVYDVAVQREGAHSVPPVEFPFFDPGPPPAYRVARTDPIPLTVGPAEAPPATPRGPERGSDGADVPGWGRWDVLAAVGAGLAAITFALLAGRRKRALEARRAALRPTRLADATAAFRAAATRPGGELAGPFAVVLAARLDCDPAAVISPDLRPRLVAAGVAPDLASRAAATLEALVAARYGGAPSVDAGAASAVVAEIDAVSAGTVSP